MSEEAKPVGKPRESTPTQRSYAAVARSLDDLRTTVDQLGTTTFQSAGKINAFIEESRDDRRQLNDRVAVLEHGALGRDEVMSAMKQVLIDADVVTGSTLGVTAYRKFLGGTKRALVTLAILSGGIGTTTVLLSHIVKWFGH